MKFEKSYVTVGDLKKLLANYDDSKPVKFYTDENQLGERYVELEVDSETVLSVETEN